MASDTFHAKDMDGKDFWVEWDGAERIGFWIGDPEGESQALDIETSDRLVDWFQIKVVAG